MDTARFANAVDLEREGDGALNHENRWHQHSELQLIEKDAGL